MFGLRVYVAEYCVLAADDSAVYEHFAADEGISKDR